MPAASAIAVTSAWCWDIAATTRCLSSPSARCATVAAWRMSCRLIMSLLGGGGGGGPPPLSGWSGVIPAVDHVLDLPVGPTLAVALPGTEVVAGPGAQLGGVGQERLRAHDRVHDVPVSVERESVAGRVRVEGAG